MNKGGRILFDRVGLLVLALVFLAGVAVVTLLPAARVDLTENQLYTLSEGTRKIVGTIPEPEVLAFALKRVPGVVEHGLFLGLADLAIVAGGGGVKALRRPGA